MRKLLLSAALLLATLVPGLAQGPGPGPGPGPVPNPWVVNGATISYNKGGVVVGNATGGGLGIGKINVSSGYYINGVIVQTIAGASPPLAINGSNVIALNYDSQFALTGGTTLTLATVNSNVGSFGSSTAIPNYTVDGKGRITASGSSAVIAPAGTLTGGTLASNVLASSLTSVGALTSGSLASGFTPVPNALLANSSTTVNGQVCTLGSTCTVTAAATGITVATTTVSGGTSGRVLYDNAGVLGELAVTGSGSAVLASAPSIASPTFTGTVAGANTIPLSILAQSGANTMLGNWTGSTANVVANNMPSCPDTGGGHLNYVSGTGITCGTTTGAAAAGTLTGTTLAANVVASSLTSVGTLTGGATGAGFTIALTTSTVTGTLPATAFPALTGDVTTAGGALATTIANNAVTNTKFRQGGALSVVGVTGNATANVADIQGTANQALRVNGAGTALAFGALDLSQSAAVTGQLVATSFPVLTGDVTTAGGALAATIANNAVTNAKSAQMAGVTLKGNPTASTANASDFTISGLTQSLSPNVTNDMLLIWDSVAGTFKKINPNTIASSATAGVSSIAGNSGAFTLSNGITNSTNDIRLASIAADTLLMNATGSTGIPSSTAVGNCATALTYDTTGHAFGCRSVTGTGNLVQATNASLVTPNLGTPSAATLTNATGLPVSTGISGLGTGIASALAVNTGTAGAPAILIASGAKALATSAIASGACTSAQTDTATGAATTDAIAANFSADPTAVTGYSPSTNGMLTIIPWVTSNTMNFKVCNNTGSSITPGAVTINWRITR